MIGKPLMAKNRVVSHRLSATAQAWRTLDARKTRHRLRAEIVTHATCVQGLVSVLRAERVLDVAGQIGAVPVGALGQRVGAAEREGRAVWGGGTI